MSETIETVDLTVGKNDKRPRQRYYAFWNEEDHQKLRSWWLH